MDHDHLKTCAMKVNINCCKACPIKLKKRLLKINGVLSVDVDPEKNLISVTGIVDHIQLIKRNTGKKAELVDKENANNNNNNNNNYNDFGQQVQSHAPKNHSQAEYNEYMASPGEFLEDVWGGRDDQVPPCYGPRMMMHAGYYAGNPPRPRPSYEHYYGPRMMPQGEYGGDPPPPPPYYHYGPPYDY